MQKKKRKKSLKYKTAKRYSFIIISFSGPLFFSFPFHFLRKTFENIITINNIKLKRERESEFNAR